VGNFQKAPTEKRKYDIISPILFGTCWNEDTMVENQVTVCIRRWRPSVEDGGIS